MSCVRVQARSTRHTDPRNSDYSSLHRHSLDPLTPLVQQLRLENDELAQRLHCSPATRKPAANDAQTKTRLVTRAFG